MLLSIACTYARVHPFSGESRELVGKGQVFRFFPTLLFLIASHDEGLASSGLGGPGHERFRKRHWPSWRLGLARRRLYDIMIL